MKHKNVFYCAGGLGAGLLLGLLLRFGAGTEHSPIPSPDLDPVTPPSSSTASSPAESSPAWDKGTVYLGGDTVQYQGQLYRAKWWTQGELPGTADVWEHAPASPAPASPAPAAPPESETGGQANTTPVPKPDGFRVVGYYPDWKPSETGKIRYDVLTHVVYAFAIPTKEGGLRPLENPETAKKILADAHAAGVKVLIAIGGWSYRDTPLEPVFISATETAEKRDAFANSIISLCEQYGFDGVDMDWEHPRVDGGSQAQYEALMLSLAERLHGRGKLLTSAVLSGATPDGNIYYDAAAHTDKVLSAVDWIHVMAYDGGDGERHSPYRFAVSSGDYWHDTRGLPASKVVLGLPFYARPSWASYGDILAAVPSASSADRVSYQGMEVYYNGPDTIREKTTYAAKELGGVMIWELTQDTADPASSLQSAIAKALA